ncbi:unnamed protein product [Oikopleura dioica]|uniref:J domain-containing protein n=1 Tax=Oikopleura dioica TaxID=34765 RepID=E4Y298_OIKDI|nr:unnamed protein product [Oikopleura dioica]
MADSTKCFYEILGVSQDAEEDEIQAAFEASKTAFEVLNDPKKRGAYDRQKAKENEKELKLKIQKLEKELENKKSQEKEQDDKCNELEKLKMEMGEIGGAGHFWGNDKATKCGGKRDGMGDEELKKVLRLLAAGEKTVNLKFRWCHNWEVAEAGWAIQFKSAYKDRGGDGKYFYLWISNKEEGGNFKAMAQEINSVTGEEANRRELQSEKDGTRQLIKYEKVAGYPFVRFNITIL